MTLAPFMQTASGRDFYLGNPTPEMVDFGDIAEHLSSSPASPAPRPAISIPWASIACAQRTRSLPTPEIAPQPPTRSSTTRMRPTSSTALRRSAGPRKQSRASISADDRIVAAVLEVPKLLRYRIDAAIHAAAGLQFPLPIMLQGIVKTIDLVMLATERRDLMRPSDSHWANLDGIMPLPDRIAPMTWPLAWREYGEALQRYLVPREPLLAHNKTPSEQGGASA